MRRDMKRPAPKSRVPARPRPAVTLAVCGAALAAGTAAVCLAFPAPPAPHPGTLHAAAAVVRAPAAGRIAAWLAEPGAAVEPDTPIAEVADAARAAALDEAGLAVTAAAAALAEAERAAELDLAWRTAEVNRDLHAVRAEAADLLRERFDLDLRADRPQARTVAFNANRASGVATAASSAAAANAREVLSARLELCDVREADLAALRAALPDRVRAAAGVPGRRAALAAATAARDAVAARPGRLTVTAGRFGTLCRPPAPAGGAVDAGAVLATVRDRDRPFAPGARPHPRAGPVPGRGRGDGRVRRGRPAEGLRRRGRQRRPGSRRRRRGGPGRARRAALARPPGGLRLRSDARGVTPAESPLSAAS